MSGRGAPTTRWACVGERSNAARLNHPAGNGGRLCPRPRPRLAAPGPGPARCAAAPAPNPNPDWLMPAQPRAHRSRAGSFSMYCRYSSSVVAPMQRSSPRLRGGGGGGGGGAEGGHRGWAAGRWALEWPPDGGGSHRRGPGLQQAGDTAAQRSTLHSRQHGLEQVEGTRSAAQHSTAQRRAGQRSTAQRSTLHSRQHGLEQVGGTSSAAQRSTAQHSAAQQAHASMGLSRLEASMAPSLLPAPTMLWISGGFIR